jgi:hypothetical protein
MTRNVEEMHPKLHIIKKELEAFDTISLREMDSVSLMDRTDMKFPLSFQDLEQLLAILPANYRVLAIAGQRVFSYRTDYFDTADMSMFNDHHNGRMNRFKIRHREYIESQLSFLEVKFKSNKGRVTKSRIEAAKEDHPAFEGFVSTNTPYDPSHLMAILVNRFYRFTLVDKQLKERVTVDFNLTFNDKHCQIGLNGLVIIELKQSRKDKSSMIYQVLKDRSIRPASISKYCLGVSLLNSCAKYNNFKKTILMINKLTDVERSA